MSAITLSLIAFMVIMGGALLGAVLHNALPGHHLADDSKDVVRLGAGLVGTIAALVLGLIIASAKSSFDAQSGHVQRLAAEISSTACWRDLVRRRGRAAIFCAALRTR